MAVKMISVKCPECGATLNIDADREQAFCTYCGAKVMIYNENEYIFRHVDEAEVKQAETDRIIKLKQLEISEQEREERKKRKAAALKVVIAIEAVGVPILIVGLILSSLLGGGEPNTIYETICTIGMLIILTGGGIAFFNFVKNNDNKEK